MKRVVAVHRVVATEIAETEEELCPFVEIEGKHVFPRVLYGCGSPAASPQYLELFKVNMDGMLPFAAAVLQNPSLNAVPLHSKANLVAAHESVVDHPTAVRL